MFSFSVFDLYQNDVKFDVLAFGGKSFHGLDLAMGHMNVGF